MSTQNLDSMGNHASNVLTYMDEKRDDGTETCSDESDDARDTDRNNNEDKSPSLDQHASKLPGTSYGTKLTNSCSNSKERQLENSTESASTDSLSPLNSGKMNY